MFGLGTFELLLLFVITFLFFVLPILVMLGILVWAVKKRQRDESDRTSHGEPR